MSWSDIPDSSLVIAQTIMQAVRVKDAETYQHCVRVSRASRLLAQAAGLNELEQKLCEFAGLFHDIGKIGVPDAILFKPGRLTPEEMEVMKDHPEMSVQILKPLLHLDFFKRLVPGVRHHHEWYGGEGYPQSLQGDKIPLAARIVLIVDTVDAMTADRAYRKGRPLEVAHQELKTYSGRQFDPALVKIYLEAQVIGASQNEAVFREMNETVLKFPKAA